MSARFTTGDRVRIAARFEERHHRVPAYVKGHVGTIERVCLAHPQPEHGAYHNLDEPKETVYRVRLNQVDLWPDYDGPADDTLEIEIFEHWLETPDHAA